MIRAIDFVLSVLAGHGMGIVQIDGWEKQRTRAHDMKTRSCDMGGNLLNTAARFANAQIALKDGDDLSLPGQHGLLISMLVYMSFLSLFGLSSGLTLGFALLLVSVHSSALPLCILALISAPRYLCRL